MNRIRGPMVMKRRRLRPDGVKDPPPTDMWTEHLEGQRGYSRSLFGYGLLAAGVLIATFMTFWVERSGLHRGVSTDYRNAALWIAVVVLVGAGVATLLISRERAVKHEHKAAQPVVYSHRQFGRHIAALGCVLILLGFSTFVGLAGLLRRGHVDAHGSAFAKVLEHIVEESNRAPAPTPPAPARTLMSLDASAVESERFEGTATGDSSTRPAGSDEARDRLAKLLLLSTELAVLGALFFVADSMRKKRAVLETDEVARGGHFDAFDTHKFWGGLFFRLGEAVLFTFAFFWLFWKYDAVTEYTWMPIVALFLGMFVKTGEKIVFGVGDRVLAASTQLFPTVSPAAAAGTTPPASGAPPREKGQRGYATAGTGKRAKNEKAVAKRK